METKISQERIQQHLREWILKQDFFSLNGKWDGMTAWELSGIILKQIDEFVSFNSPDYYQAGRNPTSKEQYENELNQEGVETTESKVFAEILNN